MSDADVLEGTKVADAALSGTKSSALTSISEPAGKTSFCTGTGFGINLGLLYTDEPFVQAKDFSGIVSFAPFAQVKQLAVPVRAFRMASIRLLLMFLPLAFAHAAMLFRNASVLRFFLLYGGMRPTIDFYWHPHLKKPFGK